MKQPQDVSLHNADKKAWANQGRSKGSIVHNTIYVLELTNKKSKLEKVNFLVTGTHHAREWISTEVPMALIADFLTKYGEDDEVTTLLDTSRIFVIPMLNPDGAVYSRKQKRM